MGYVTVIKMSTPSIYIHIYTYLRVDKARTISNALPKTNVFFLNDNNTTAKCPKCKFKC